MTLTHDPMAALHQDNPGWSFFTTTAGRIWAIYKKITHQDLARGCVATLDADTAQELAKLVATQNERRAATVAQ